MIFRWKTEALLPSLFVAAIIRRRFWRESSSATLNWNEKEGQSLIPYIRRKRVGGGDIAQRWQGAALLDFDHVSDRVVGALLDALGGGEGGGEVGVVKHGWAENR